IGACAPADVGVTVLATVVSHQPGSSQLIVDAGALELSKDLGPGHLGLPVNYGEVKAQPGLLVTSVSQEHGIIRAAAPLDGQFAVGTQIEIVPNHSCLTVAHFDEYHVMKRGREIDRWKIERGR
ncbi:MAG TPA: hypothetical protein VI160_10305, partial [Gemmatimonadales bacterium]